MGLSRRRFLAATGVSLTAAALAGCGAASAGSVPGTLTFALWATDAEMAAFTSMARAFERRHRGIKVALQQMPYDQIKQTVDARLQAEVGPDLFRVSYTDIGIYSSQKVLVDLSRTLGPGFGARFLPSLWAAVQYEGRPYGVPHHTDTSALLFNRSHFARAGVTDVPERPAEAWSWAEFIEIAERVRAANKGSYPFAANWQQAGAYRWFNWLFQAGGHALSPDLKHPRLDSPAGRKALAYTKSFYDKGLMPANLLVKNPTTPDMVFPSQKISMMYGGDFLLPALKDAIKGFEVGVAPLPRDVADATDLGGNAVVATTQGKNQALAAEFCKFLVEPANMKAFCEVTAELPTLRSLRPGDLRYRVYPELLPAFQRQLATMPVELARTVTVPDFAVINDALERELEEFFTGGQSADDTLGNLASAINKTVNY